MNAQVARGVPEAPTRILLVDDDQSLRLVTQRVLIRNGYLVECAADGRAGWETLQAGGFDLLITDHTMPLKTGIELVRALRLAGMTIPVILMTAVRPEAEVHERASLRIDATLIKPFEASHLLTTVETTLTLARRSIGG